MSYQPFQPVLTSDALYHAGIQLHWQRPSGALATRVYAWLQLEVTQACDYQVVPDACISLFFSPHKVMVAGTQRQLRRFTFPYAGQYFGIAFYPGAIKDFFRVDLTEAKDCLLGDDFLPAAQLRDLHHQLYEVTEFEQRVQACERWAISHLTLSDHSGKALFEHAVGLMSSRRDRGTPAQLGVAKLADQLGYSRRHLNRVFQRFSGLDCKGVSQILRRQAVLQQLYLGHAPDAQFALDHGFCDQAHLINDFKQACRTSPKQFMQQLTTG
ncbi:helix-turn-helix transcriptional regulator [Motilimonas pumila]|nr:helix-turn-helix domain-containing protein [Motilimonas pumila]